MATQLVTMVTVVDHGNLLMSMYMKSVDRQTKPDKHVHIVQLIYSIKVVCFVTSHTKQNRNITLVAKRPLYHGKKKIR